jgi:acetyl esterase/lipase
MVTWLFVVITASGAIGTANALWPCRRPWWLKLPSFNLGWFANELPLHALVWNAVVVVVGARLGALDERPARLGLVLVAASSVGLVVLAAAHRSAAIVTEHAVDTGFGVDESHRPEPLVDHTLPRTWRVFPWLAWFGAPGVERVGGVVYATVGGRNLKLDLYRPSTRPPRCPVLVEVHGGGWSMGHRRFDARPLMARMAAHGWVCVSIDYRLSRRATWPDHIVDVKTALAWVREHVAEYGGDPDFVAITGGSAGGHLAALAALSVHDTEYQPLFGADAPVRACVSFYGVYDFDNRLGLRTAAETKFLERNVVKRSQADAPQVYEHASPLARVGEHAPPFMVVQGTSDNLVPPSESRAFVDALRQTSRAPVVYAEIPRGHHAFDAVPSVRTAGVIAGVEQFLSQTYSSHRSVPRTGTD